MSAGQRGVLADLLALLDLERTGEDRFRGHSSNAAAGYRLFGGHVAAQSLAAAGRTIGIDRHPATIQCTFLRAGRPDEPLDFAVERVGDGRSFSFRRVLATQRDKPIFSMLATFHTGDEAPGHSTPFAPVAPESLPEFTPQVWTMVLGAFEVRRAASEPGTGSSTMALRTAGPMPDDPLLHACVLAYASDLYILDTPLTRHGIVALDQGVDSASVDHAVWFHHRPKVDDWLVYDLVSPIGHDGRALIRGELHTESGTLIASVTQLAMLRVTTPRDGTND
ncbi:MAG TPA: acyl-CoA thioesterase domain-containing protein [Mycobacteriales bacterium]|nr:acyl-CoA thioesterase domain-containing protein [Mycobacteriales bacterium]